MARRRHATLYEASGGGAGAAPVTSETPKVSLNVAGLFPRLQRFSPRTCLVRSRVQAMSASQGRTPNGKGRLLKVLCFLINTSSQRPRRPFLRSRSQPKPRRSLRSRYADMMESIRPRPNRQGSSDYGSSMTRRTRSSSITSPISLTNPTTQYQGSSHGRLGSKFSILKPTVSRSQTPHVSSPKILALPPWLRDTITELDGSHPLRGVFPPLHDDPDPITVKPPSENPPDYRIPQRGVNQSFCFPSTPLVPSRTRLPHSDTSSDEPQAFSSRYPLYHNDPLLHLRCGSPTPSAGALSHSEVAFHTASNPNPNPSAPINMAKTPHICGVETTSLPAPSSNHNLRDPGVSPAAQRDVEGDDIFRYDPSRADSTMALPPSEPFVFGRPTRVYFDSPIEDPISSDPLEPSDYDPFKLDPEEYKNLGFKWAPFHPQAGVRREPISSEPETSAEPPSTGEVIASVVNGARALLTPLAAVAQFVL